LAGITILFIAFLLYFFISTDAPIIQGEVVHQINYKNDLTLDVYQPVQTRYKNSPVVVFFHGGAWIMGAKESININRFNGAINKLREKGYAVVAPNYTLARREHSPFPDCIEDARDVIQWIGQHADEYNFDTRNVGIFGESAGAHIALMVAFQQEDRDFNAMSEQIGINYVVDMYGPSHLESLYHIQALDSVRIMMARIPDHLRSCVDVTQHLFGFNPG